MMSYRYPKAKTIIHMFILPNKIDTAGYYQSTSSIPDGILFGVTHSATTARQPAVVNGKVAKAERWGAFVVLRTPVCRWAFFVASLSNIFL